MAQEARESLAHRRDTVKEFNDMLKAFVEDLAYVFPEETSIVTFAGMFDTVVAFDPRKSLDAFLDAVRPHAAMVVSRDPRLFDHLVFPGGIDFAKLWAEDLSDDTRDKIWEYLATLLFMGNMAVAVQPEVLDKLPPEVLSTVETLAAEFAEKVQAGGDVDFEGLLERVKDSTQGMDLSALSGIDVSGIVQAIGGEDVLKQAGIPPALLHTLSAVGPGANEDVLKLLEGGGGLDARALEAFAAAGGRSSGKKPGGDKKSKKPGDKSSKKPKK